MKAIKILGAIILVPIAALLLYSNIPFSPPATRINEGKVLTSTHWMGEGDYARFAPGPASNTLGCWSTTFSQISHYHRLQPTGTSQYACTKGYKIDENLDNHQFDWGKFRHEITDGYSFDEEDFMVHLNSGWGCRNDGWYNLFDSIATEGDTQLRLLIAVQPVEST